MPKWALLAGNQTLRATKPTHWIIGGTSQAHFKMQVGAGYPSAGANGPDYLARLYALAFADADT